ncbi:hypothetical protein [Ferriphaselus sp. R-1]|uniref:hypothetical protein n=1 Tax=Ferriphaselus sp. R-1 TaxID=1485544 RepID=UPI00054E039A|nr:hypothetical protein [Ferriphaselus sp. R-1]
MYHNLQEKKMSRHSDQVALGFMRLSEEERTEAIKKMSDFLNTTEHRKSMMMESVRIQAGLDHGQLDQRGCRCCGRLPDVHPPIPL